MNSKTDEELRLMNKDINTQDMIVLHITTTPSFPGIFATNLIVGPGRLRMFEGGEVLNDPNEGIVRTTFYDTAGVPTGSEPVLFSFLSFCEKSSGNATRDFQQHTFNFPGAGARFKEGIGYIADQMDGNPQFIAVDGCLYYNRL